MLRMNELEVGHVYRHDNGTLVRLLRWLGDSESGGAVTVEMLGEIETIGMALFLRKFNVISVAELTEDAKQNQG